ncbi:uncharacterized protein LOC141655922 isoform X2 [Silene latifolia]|uniref:uncharacterized protein LOC141655922 isoform X2 n=1 Tax=Silene latifolia TaxID=37657 RepID=UPI003D76BD6F
MNKDISSIVEYCKTDYQQDLMCYCVAKVKDIGTERLWHYTSCFGCTNKPIRRKIESDLWCSKCHKTIETQTIRYCIDLKVEDQNCKAIFVVFDTDARRLIGQDAVTLYDAQPIEDEDDEDFNPVPKLIQNTFVGKEFMFKIKIQASNHGPDGISNFKVINIAENPVIEVNEASSSSLTSVKKGRNSVVILDELSEKESTEEEALHIIQRTTSKAKGKAKTTSGRKRRNSVVILDDLNEKESDEEETLLEIQRTSKAKGKAKTTSGKKRRNSLVLLDELNDLEPDEEETLLINQKKLRRERTK